MYSASVEERAISVCSLDEQSRRHLAYETTYPIRDLAVAESSTAVDVFHSATCEASNQQSNEAVSDGWTIIPLSAVTARYRPINLTASPCERRGSLVIS